MSTFIRMVNTLLMNIRRIPYHSHPFLNSQDGDFSLTPILKYTFQCILHIQPSKPPVFTTFASRTSLLTVPLKPVTSFDLTSRSDSLLPVPYLRPPLSQLQFPLSQSSTLCNYPVVHGRNRNSVTPRVSYSLQINF